MIGQMNCTSLDFVQSVIDAKFMEINSLLFISDKNFLWRVELCSSYIL